MRPYIRLLSFVFILPVLCAFTLEEGSGEISSSVTVAPAQPADERAAQDNLPMAKGAIWDALLKTKVSFNEESGEYSATFPEAVTKLGGQTLRVSGFILPLESSETFTHFLLSKRTPTCAFCPPGGPGEIIEVYTKTPIEWYDGLVEVEGTFGFIENKELGVFFKLSDAKVR